MIKSELPSNVPPTSVVQPLWPFVGWQESLLVKSPLSPAPDRHFVVNPLQGCRSGVLQGDVVSIVESLRVGIR